MQTMYPSKVGSPTTIITGNLATSTDTIPVQDIEAFTDAPGLATLFDETGKQEVVLYTGISFETLTGVTRAFEGTASTWSTGTFIARLLTAHDINTLQANVNTLDGEKTDGATFTNHVQSIASDTVLGHVKVGTNLTITGDGTLNAEAGGASSADEVAYSNTTSGLTATDVQAAIDEVDGDLDTHKAENATLTESAHVQHGTYTATLLSTGWVGESAPYSQTLTVTGMTATDNPVVDVDLSGALDYAAEQEILTDWGEVYRIVTGTDEITVYANAKTVGDVDMQLKVVR